MYVVLRSVASVESDSVGQTVARELQSVWLGSFVHGISQARTRGGLPRPPGDLPNPGIEPMSLMSPALAGKFFTTHAAWEACVCILVVICLPNDILHHLYSHLDVIPVNL